ncbi:MAG: hypothetical protein M3O15_00390 [Acidobacteriota bacterium]|nr:hypothetical protein [Acidobacteriota bacterium]
MPQAQYVVAEHAGITPGILSRYRRKRTCPKVETLGRLLAVHPEDHTASAVWARLTPSGDCRGLLAPAAGELRREPSQDCRQAPISGRLMPLERRPAVAAAYSSPESLAQLLAALHRL